MAGSVTIYLRGYVRLFASQCVVRLCVYVRCVFVISNKSTSKTPHVSGLSKVDTLLHKTHSNVVMILKFKVRYV